jgi:hypothetical protein
MNDPIDFSGRIIAVDDILVFDFLGRTIAVDDILVYPVRRGSKMWLNRIKVTKVECDTIHGTSLKNRPVRLTNLKNTVVIRPGETTPPIQQGLDGRGKWAKHDRR